MNRYDRLYRLYEAFDTESLRAYRDFVDLLPPIDSRIALAAWQEATEEIDRQSAAIHEAFPDVGETYATLASVASRDQAFTALDLASSYGRAVSVLVLDVDETLRSAGRTDNEIPRDTLNLIGKFHERGIPIVICTGQPLEHVRGFAIQGLGSELVHSGRLSIVYESGAGVFTPGHGSETKRLLYETLSADVRSVFDAVRTGVLTGAPDTIRTGCHLQGNEFNVTVKPNVETGSRAAREIVDTALLVLLDRLAAAIADAAGTDPDPVAEWVRSHYADADPEIRSVLEREGGLPASSTAPPEAITGFLERIDVAYYPGDAVEITSLELTKVEGVEAAYRVLGIDDPFALVMGDSKSDLRVMEWVAANESGIAAAPNHASEGVLEHVVDTDELVFEPGRAADVLRTVYALNCLAPLE